MAAVDQCSKFFDSNKKRLVASYIRPISSQLSPNSDPALCRLNRRDTPLSEVHCQIAHIANSSSNVFASFRSSVIETFGKPAVDRSEKLVCLIRLP